MRSSTFSGNCVGRWFLSACVICASLCSIGGMQVIGETTLAGQAVKANIEGPISFKPAKPLPADKVFELTGTGAEGTPAIAAQTDAQGVLWWWSVPSQDASYKLKKGKAKPRVVLTKDGSEAVKVTIDDKLFTVFNFKKSEPRVYLYPLIGPTGVGVTRDHIMKDKPLEKDNKRQDHPHHRSMWTAHGDIRIQDFDKKGYDFWAEPKKKPLPKQVLTKISRMVSGPVFGQIEAEIEWQTDEGQRLFTEIRTYSFHVGSSDQRIIDQTNVFRFNDMDVKFGNTKEGGMIALRLAVTMDEKGVTTPKPMHGQMTNSVGGIGAEECWGKAADWCDYVGPLDGQNVGVAVLDNPANFRHPTRWHIRDYGLYTANPFGLADFVGDKTKDGSHLFKKGESAEFKYRVVIHKADTKAAHIAEQWSLYSNPPKVSVK